MLKLKLKYFGPLTQRADSLEKTLMPGKIEGRRRRERQSMRWLDGITDIDYHVINGHRAAGMGGLCPLPVAMEQTSWHLDVPTLWALSSCFQLRRPAGSSAESSLSRCQGPWGASTATRRKFSWGLHSVDLKRCTDPTFLLLG